MYELLMNLSYILEHILVLARMYFENIRVNLYIIFIV